MIALNQGEGLDKRKKSKEKDRTSFRYFALDDSFASFTPG
jgi:hypothetical protein